MAEIREGDAAIRKYLREIAEAEKKEYEVLTNRNSPATQRGVVVKKMAQPREQMNGFFHAIQLIYGSNIAEFYQQYFYQARSDEGVTE